MSVRTRQPAEIFTILPPNGTPPGSAGYTPEPRNWVFFQRTKLVPRLFKAANGGAASRDGHGWPYDGSDGGLRIGSQMGHLPHLAVHLIIPDRRSGLTSSGDVMHPASTQRIPPVLVRTRST